MTSTCCSTSAWSWCGSIREGKHNNGRDLGLRGWEQRRAQVSFASRRSRRLLIPIAGIHIDRKHHLNQSWRRQQEAEARQAEAEVTCPVDCVREVYNYAEFEKVLKETSDLVVVDFYNSSCGACKYVLPQFVKLCKNGCTDEESEDAQRGVLFVKHNVRDEYDDLTDMARLYSIRHVPMFSFFVDGSRVEQFPTRDRARLEESISRLLTKYGE